MWVKHSLSRQNNTESVFDLIVAALGQLYLFLSNYTNGLDNSKLTIEQVLQSFHLANKPLSV